MPFLTRLDEVKKELLYCPPASARRWPSIGVGGSVGVGGGVGISKMLKFLCSIFYMLGKALTGELSCPL